MSKRVGIMTPMANPTVEAEMRRLLPDDVDFVVARLVSGNEDSLGRLVDYARDASETVRQFGGMEMAAIGFACTGSSYLMDREAETGISSGFGIPFLFAAATIEAELRRRGARRIAVISPYPPPLHEAALAHWRRLGFEIADQARVEIGSTDTRNIYRLSGEEARPAIEAARGHGPDLILLSGTGMPTLRLVEPAADIPILSSNWCLAQALSRSA
jgi:maleate isomerase